MSEQLSPPVQMTLGHGRIEASWIDDTAIWVSDYYPNTNPVFEELQFERRSRVLAHRFGQYKLIAPQIERVGHEEEAIIDPFIEELSTAGEMALRVTTLLMPYVNDNYLRPIVELRIPAPQPDFVEHELVVRDLKAGGTAIYDCFATSILPRKS